MVEFDKYKHQTLEFKFQVDKTSNPEKQANDVIIGNDLLSNIGFNILYRREQIQWDDDEISLNTIDNIKD